MVHFLNCMTLQVRVPVLSEKMYFTYVNVCRETQISSGDVNMSINETDVEHCNSSVYLAQFFIEVRGPSHGWSVRGLVVHIRVLRNSGKSLKIYLSDKHLFYCSPTVTGSSQKADIHHRQT